MTSLAGKKALITGASGGIGGAIARALKEAGATVAISGTRIEALDALNDRVQCLRERSRYQQQYPKGVHAESVQHRCGR